MVVSNVSNLELQLASAIFWRRFFEVYEGEEVKESIAFAAVAGLEELLEVIDRVDNPE